MDPYKKRVNIQTEKADPQYIIDGQWVAVGLKNDYAIGRDTTLLPLGEPAYRFELRSGDNTIEGLFPGQKVARAELSYCYAVASDYKNETSFEQARRRKTVHYSGKGACSQGAHMEYVFRILVPGSMEPDADVILPNGMECLRVPLLPILRVTICGRVFMALPMRRRILFFEKEWVMKKESLTGGPPIMVGNQCLLSDLLTAFLCEGKL